MSDYFVYYTESNIVCLIVFGIILLHDVFNIDRQEKQIKYDRALIAFMLYFITDMFWAAVIAGVVEKKTITVLVPNFLNFVFLANITYSWLQYVMAVEQMPDRNKPLNRIAAALPFALSVIALVLIYLISPRAIIDSEGSVTMLYNMMLVAVPIVYIIAILAFTLRRARAAKNPDEKRQHLFVGLFPLLVVAGGLLQILVMPNTPVFCFSCAILMLIFNIQATDSQISLDPLTGLNNRGQLNRYVSQDSNMHREGRYTFVIMFDANDFKVINDSYGHAEGDRALVIIAEALKKAVGGADMPLFLARYGGDEFILIIHPEEKTDADRMIKKVRVCLEEECKAAGIPYTIGLGAGCAELSGEKDTFQKCMVLADQQLYDDKRKSKTRVAATT